MKAKIITALIVLIFTLSTTCIAISVNKGNSLSYAEDEPEISWQYNFGGNLRDYGMDGLVTADGYIIAGNYGEGEKGWIIKTDLQGNIVMDQKYGSTDTNYFRKIIDLNDGYLVGGSSYSESDSSRDFWVVKIFEDGSVDWSKKYGFQNSLELFTDFTQSTDGGYVILGSSLTGEDFGSPLFIKIDENGEEISRFIYDRYTDDDTEDTHLFDIDTTSDGGYICTGYIQEPFLSDYEFLLLKLDENLNEEWNATFDSGTGFDWAYDVVETGTGYIMVGEYYYEKAGRPHEGAWIVSSGLSGNLLWEKKFQGVNNHASAYFIEKLDDGNYIVTGEVGQIGDNFHKNLWVLKIDISGNQIWSLETGKEYSDDGSCVRQTSDGGYFVVGTLMTEYDGWTFDQDVWILKLNTGSAGYKPDEPTGATIGETGLNYVYSTNVNHPNGLDVQYGWSWGDGEDIEWTEEFYESGERVEKVHSWAKDGLYTVRVKARDANGMESKWSDALTVQMPRTVNVFSFLFDFIYEKFSQYQFFKEFLNF